VSSICPNGIKLAVDAKFPYDAFERSLDEEDADARRELQSKHAVTCAVT